jgi:hypothetical protein
MKNEGESAENRHAIRTVIPITYFAGFFSIAGFSRLLSEIGSDPSKSRNLRISLFCRLMASPYALRFPTSFIFSIGPLLREGNTINSLDARFTILGSTAA